MRITSILAGEFKLDGGAMFGVVPKSIWNRDKMADEENLISLAMRCLLVEIDEKIILIDTGIGNKLPQKIAPYYHIHPDISLEQSLHEKGVSSSQITDVILTHLHLDHAGGAISLDRHGRLVSSFQNATYWVSKLQWDWATKNPNPREKASFREENLMPLEVSNQLKWLDTNNHPFTKYFITFLMTNGHTRGMLLPLITYKEKRILFAADVLPSIYHIPVPYIPSYDVLPLESMQEKENILAQCSREEIIVFLDHDIKNECCLVYQNERRGYELKDTFPLNSCL